MSQGLQEQMNELLQELVRQAGYTVALVCTDEGLLVAASADEVDTEQLAALTSLFDEIVQRARRDMAMACVDEVTMLDAQSGRLVIRPLDLPGAQRFFLVVRVPGKATWRRNTNEIGRRLVGLLGPVAAEA